VSKSNKLKGGQAAVQALKREKTKHVFGLIGSATMEMFDALYHEKDIKFIGVRDERTGTHMADGYARASNRPGVILAGQMDLVPQILSLELRKQQLRFLQLFQLQDLFQQKIKSKTLFKVLINNLYSNQ
jgi:hypothetical protein